MSVARLLPLRPRAQCISKDQYVSSLELFPGLYIWKALRSSAKIHYQTTRPSPVAQPAVPAILPRPVITTSVAARGLTSPTMAALYRKSSVPRPVTFFFPVAGLS